MPIKQELLDEILKDYEKPEDLLGDNGLLQQLTKALVERALDGELLIISATKSTIHKGPDTVAEFISTKLKFKKFAENYRLLFSITAFLNWATVSLQFSDMLFLPFITTNQPLKRNINLSSER